MKNKKWIWIVASVVAVILIGGFSVVGVVEWDREAHEQAKETAKSDVFVERQDAPKEKVFQAKGDETAESKPLTYDRTMVVENGQEVDFYIDKDNVEYQYNAEGEMVGMIDPNVLKPTEEDEEETITEEQAIEIAYKNGVDLYGSEMEGFSLEKCAYRDTGVYSVVYSKRYGKDGYILGPVIYFTITETGELFGTTNKNRPEFNDLDLSLLENFDKADVEAFIAKQINEKYGDKVKEYSISSIQLLYDQKYYLGISVDITLSNHYDVEIFEYDFPQ